MHEGYTVQGMIVKSCFAFAAAWQVLAAWQHWGLQLGVLEGERGWGQQMIRLEGQKSQNWERGWGWADQRGYL